MNNPLLDYNFLTELMNYRQREIYARITLLTQDELPVEYIEGRVTGGSINVDGNSALRRTCNLTMILKNQSEINQFNWTFKSKFKLEVGIKNFINKIYPDIIWFKQGLFILTTCNMNQTTNNYTITINGKDKMCLLNGDIGGVIPHSTDFGTEEYFDKDTNTITYNKILIKDIIRNALLAFGGESPENIIINDLDEAGFELLEYKYEEAPLYLFRNVTDNQVAQVTMDPNHIVYLNGQEISISDETKLIYAKTSDLQDDRTASIIMLKDDNKEYNIIRLEYGDLAGYRLTDLVYAGELIANIGETLTSVLDKIKQMLGNFEYFYSIDGKFVFQRKRTYISTPWTALEEDQNNIINLAINDSYPKINLMDAKLTTSFANNPNLLNVKNDFSVWGTYKSLSGADIPIHMRYALDTKPTKYQTIRSLWTRRDGSLEEPPSEYIYFKDILREEVWTDENGINMRSSYLTKPFIAGSNSQDKMIVDWREIIYQMALDYYSLNKEDDFYLKVAAANPDYPTGKTGYEQYYADIQGFWRQLYNPDPEDGFEENSAATINTLEESILKTDLFVDNYYTPINKNEYYDLDNNINNIFDEEGNIKEDWPFLFDDLYVISTNIVKDNNGKEFEKITFYPFIRSQYCHLNTNKEYWYYNGTKYIKTKDDELLNMRTLIDIYEDDGTGKKQSVVNISFKNFITNLWENKSQGSPKLWIKQQGKILFNKLDPLCQQVYRGGKTSWKTDAYQQHLINWAIKDNYWNLSNTSETTDRITYLLRYDNGDYDEKFWNKTIKDAPGSLYFWFDFLETENSDLYKYSVKQIGVRTKSINDSNVKSIYYRDVPTVLFVQDLADEKYDPQPGYTYIQLPIGYSSLFTISGKGISAKEKVDELLEEHSYITEQVNITTIPLYHLEPNTRVLVRDDKSKIDGEYIVSKITIPLAYNGTMNLTTTKVISSIM